jgi:hypothetical protein
MSSPLPSHKTARRSVLAPLALSGVLLLPFGLISSALAQSNGASTFGSGHAGSGTVPSVASLSHNNSASITSGVKSSAKPPHSTNGTTQSSGHPQQHSANHSAFYPYLYAVPFPYPADVIDNGASDDNDPNYQGGPTVFDRRGQGVYSYIPPGAESPAAPNAEPAQTEDAPVSGYNPGPAPPLEPTVLVFKDGHQLEIANYAIVNQTLYDLTPGHPRKIALAELDLSATEKQNDNHGVTFQLPQAN